MTSVMRSGRGWSRPPFQHGRHRIRFPAARTRAAHGRQGAAALRFTCICASGEVPVATGPQDPAAAGRDRLRAGHVDREQVIDTLKTAFVHGRLTRDELDARAGQALAGRTYADLAALTADIPAEPAAAGPACPPARPAAGRWPGRPPGRAAAWSSRSLPCGPVSSSIRVPLTPLPIIPGLACALSWPLSPYSWQWASWGSGWSPQWIREALAGSCRPDRGRAPTPWKADGAATPAMARFPPNPAPARPAPTCGLTSHGSTGGPASALVRQAQPYWFCGSSACGCRVLAHPLPQGHGELRRIAWPCPLAHNPACQPDAEIRSRIQTGSMVTSDA